MQCYLLFIMCFQWNSFKKLATIQLLVYPQKSVWSVDGDK